MKADDVKISHPDKVLFPDCSLTKQDSADYYKGTTDRMLPYLKNRPLTLRRYPDGDLLWGDLKDLPDVPSSQLERLEHYFPNTKSKRTRKTPVTVLGHCNREKAVKLFNRAR